MSDQWTDNQPEDALLISMPIWVIVLIMACCLVAGGLVGDIMGANRTTADLKPEMVRAALTLAHAEGQLDMCHAIVEALNSDGKFFVINAPSDLPYGGG